MPTRNVVRVPRHAIGVVKAALFPSAIPSSNDLAASGMNLGITTAKAKDSSAATDLIIAHGGEGSETAATPNKEGAVRNVVVDSEAAPDTSSAAAVHHAIQRKNFESVLDYLETKYVKSIVTDNDADEGCNGGNDMNQSQSTVENTTTMVTRTVVRITSLSAAAGNKPAAIKTTKNKQSLQSKKMSSTSPAVSLDKKDILQKRRKKTICSHPSCTKRAQHPSTLCWRHGAKDVTCSFDGCNRRGILLGLCPDHGGLVQLCRWKGCINKVNLERRGGMCWMHQDDSVNSDSEDEESEDDGEIRLCSFKGCISVATDGGMCVRHSTTYDDDCVDQNRENKKRPLPLWRDTNDQATMKRRR